MPTNRLIKSKCAESVLRMIKETKHEIIGHVSTRGYNTAENRNHIIAQSMKCDYLFLTDDDMVYEPDTIDKLIDSDKDIVGGMYKTKYENQDWVLEADKINDIMFECKGIGGGLLMIKTDVFKKIPQPHFGYLWHSNGMVKESNDWYFCRKAREFGYKVWCNAQVTAQHLGTKKY